MFWNNSQGKSRTTSRPSRPNISKIRNGQIRYCSIGFQPEEKRYDGKVLEFSRAALTEISLCDGTVPAWYSTHIEALAE